jgi:ATP-dependent Clp protease protease subunit
MSFKFSKRKSKNEDIEEHEHDELDEDDEEEESETTEFVVPPELRTIGLFGPVEEEKISDLISGLLVLSEPKRKKIVNEDGTHTEQVEPIKPVEFMINTPGGNADDMFALYDYMRIKRDVCEIRTYGLGKVMSAGVLLLAAGTKGQRKIGKHCRVMIHSVIGGSAGSYHNLENEMEEIRYIQDTYLKALSSETNMSYNQLRKMIDKKVNVYLSAQEAVKLGIADIIV